MYLTDDDKIPVLFMLPKVAAPPCAFLFSGRMFPSVVFFQSPSTGWLNILGTSGRFIDWFWHIRYRERHKICPFLNLEMDDDWINYRVVATSPNQTSCVSLYLICKEFERHKICPFLRLATDSKEKNCFASKILRYKFLHIFGGRGGGDRWSPFNSFWRYYFKYSLSSAV